MVKQEIKQLEQKLLDANKRANHFEDRLTQEQIEHSETKARLKEAEEVIELILSYEPVPSKGTIRARDYIQKHGVKG